MVLAETQVEENTRWQDTEVCPEIEEAMIKTKEQRGISLSRRRSDRLSLRSFVTRRTPGRCGHARAEGEEVTFS